MRQETTAVGEARVSLLIMLLVLVLVIAFLALAGVQTVVPLPDAKTPVAFLALRLPL